ncbi:hypothetical protein SLEP1_g19861 [Rubroshorea leprosula]|uniref:HMA domain-containing protein n=1 Tax=Rubroshorea leprosula TaxID=152421 RepID=A0AAV5J9M4_9ROSI|nr:hypothetical protein SLEP1_g19861 [Rubroshorea leprosula]
MKGMDIFCASPASTAICSSIDHRTIVRHSHNRHPISRSNPKPYIPCSSSQFPVLPQPYNNHEKSRKSSSAKQSDLRRKSSADIDDLIRSPHDSSRYLLTDRPFIDWLSEKTSDTGSALVPAQPAAKPKPRPISSNDSLVLKSSPTRSRDQVVVLWVSIHCKGCEGKVRKHISRMEGVTSFSIDLASKKVTVVGDVTPLGVLASISRVKNAQLWPSSTPTPTPTPSSAPASPAVNIIRY